MKSSIKKRFKVGTKIMMIDSFFDTPYKSMEIINAHAKTTLDVQQTLDSWLADGTGFIKEGWLFLHEKSKNPRINIERSIKKVQTNSIQFDDDCWLYFPPASQSEMTGDTFSCWDIHKETGVRISQLYYKFLPTRPSKKEFAQFFKQIN